MQVVVIPAWGESLGSLSAYAAQADALGMSVMWELSNPSWWRDPPTTTGAAGAFAAFAQACGCDQNGPLLAFTTGWLGRLPGTYGYYAADDSMLAAGGPARCRFVRVPDQAAGFGPPGDDRGVQPAAGDRLPGDRGPDRNRAVSGHDRVADGGERQSIDVGPRRAIRGRGPRGRRRRRQAVSVHPSGVYVGRQPRRRRSGRSVHRERHAAVLLRQADLSQRERPVAAAQRGPAERAPAADPLVVFPGHLRAGRKRHVLDLSDGRGGHGEVERPGGSGTSTVPGVGGDRPSRRIPLRRPSPASGRSGSRG